MLKARLTDVREATEACRVQSEERIARSAEVMARSTEQLAKSSFAVHQSRLLIERGFDLPADEHLTHVRPVKRTHE